MLKRQPALRQCGRFPVTRRSTDAESASLFWIRLFSMLIIHFWAETEINGLRQIYRLQPAELKTASDTERTLRQSRRDAAENRATILRFSNSEIIRALHRTRILFPL